MECLQGKVLERAAAFHCTTQHDWEKWASFQALSRTSKPLPTFSSDTPCSIEGILFSCKPCASEVCGCSGTCESILPVWASHWDLGQQVSQALLWCNKAILWAEVKMGLCCGRIGLCRPSSASVTWTSSNNEGDLTHNSSSKVLRDLYMMLLSQCSLELLLVPPTLIHSHRAWPRKKTSPCFTWHYPQN